MTRAWAVEFSPTVRVNAVAAGPVYTDGAAPERTTALGATTPLNRAADAAEIAEVVAFLASPRASYVTGAVMAADGDAPPSEGVEKRPPPSSSHDDPTKEDTVKYMLLIHQGTTPTPNSPEDWARLSQEEQNEVYAAYQKINQNPGVTAGLGLAPPETATTVRVQTASMLTTDGPFVETKEALGGYLIFEADDLDAAIELAATSPQPPWAVPSRCARWLSGSTARAGLPRPVGARARHADRLPRRLRPRRGSRPGGVRDRRQALAGGRHAGQPRRPGPVVASTGSVGSCSCG